jgi:hypothetical protein
MGLEVGEKLGIGQFPQARRLIRHGIHRARNVIMQSDVAMRSLVKRLDPEEVSGWAGSSRGTFALPGKGRGVVMRRVQGALAKAKVMNQNVVVQDSGEEL